MDEIKKLFPYQFSGKRNLGHSLPKGWIPAFKQLCIDVDNLLGPDKRGFYWIQLKEKFGSARYYWEMYGVSDTIVDLHTVGSVATSITIPSSNDLLRTKLRSLISSAQDATSESCAVCGEPGILDSAGGWILVLCKDHALQRHQEIAHRGRASLLNLYEE
jgi:hypothetical protein